VPPAFLRARPGPPVKPIPHHIAFFRLRTVSVAPAFWPAGDIATCWLEHHIAYNWVRFAKARLWGNQGDSRAEALANIREAIEL
jgi:hypothetical protein